MRALRTGWLIPAPRTTRDACDVEKRVPAPEKRWEALYRHIPLHANKTRLLTLIQLRKKDDVIQERRSTSGWAQISHLISSAPQTCPAGIRPAGNSKERAQPSYSQKLLCPARISCLHLGVNLQVLLSSSVKWLIGDRNFSGIDFSHRVFGTGLSLVLR